MKRKAHPLIIIRTYVKTNMKKPIKIIKVFVIAISRKLKNSM